MPSPLRRLALAAAAAGLVTLSTAPLAIAAPFNPFAPRKASPSASATPSAAPTDAPVADEQAAPAGASPSNVSWPQRPMKSSDAMTSPCADVLFVSVRASLQGPGYGAALRNVRNDIKDRFATTGATKVREAWLEYPAAFPTATDWATDALGMTFSARPPKNAYANSVERGRQNLLRLLDDSATRCSSERVMLVGYSQGAQVITEALASRRHDDRLLGTVLLGSPLNMPGRGVTKSGTADQRALGVITMLNYSRTFTVPGQGTSASRDRVTEAVQAGRGEVDPGRAAKAAHDGLIGDAAGEASALRAELESARTQAPLTPYDNLDERTESVCLSTDWVCDSAGALASASKLRSDAMTAYGKAFSAHLSYSRDAWLPAVERMSANASRRYATPSVEADPVAMPVPVPAAAEDINSMPPVPVGTKRADQVNRPAAVAPTAPAAAPPAPSVPSAPSAPRPTTPAAESPQPEQSPAPESRSDERHEEPSSHSWWRPSHRDHGKPTYTDGSTKKKDSAERQADEQLSVDPQTQRDVVWSPRRPTTEQAQVPSGPAAPALPLVPLIGQQRSAADAAQQPQAAAPNAPRPGGAPTPGTPVAPSAPRAPEAGLPANPDTGILPEGEQKPKASLNNADRDSRSVAEAKTVVPGPPVFGLVAGAMAALGLGGVLLLRRGGLGL